MKTKKELNEKLAALTDEELTQVTGGRLALPEEMIKRQQMPLSEELKTQPQSGSIQEVIGEWDIKAR